MVILVPCVAVFSVALYGDRRRSLAVGTVIVPIVFVAALVAELRVLGSIDGLGLFDDLLAELAVGAVLTIGGISGHPGAVEGDRPD